MKNIRKKVLLLFLVASIIFSTKIFATEEFKAIEKSAEFEKWENLSDEERKNAIQPAYNDLKIEDSLKRSTYSKLRSVGDSQLEARYFLNNNIVKNQQQTGLCWAFSFTSSLESSIAKKYDKTSLEYSPIYTDYVVSRSFRKSIGDGANSHIAIASAVSGKGAAYETDMPFSNYYNEENNTEESYYLSYDNVDLTNIEPKVKINETTRFASIYKQYATDNSVTYKDSSSFIGANTYTEEEVNAIRTQIKNHIKEHGAVMSYTYTGNAGNDYNQETNAFYSKSNLVSDHAITIVGWDDNYSHTNFKEGNQPKNDGAYIVLNSWGSEFGDNGYYYISYDDAYIEEEIQGINDVQEYSEEEKDYDNLYQYDELGQSLQFYFVADEENVYTEGYLANVFTRENTDKCEYISELGIYVPVTEGIEVYVDYLNSDMKDYELVASYTGTNALEPGYHTVKLASPLKIEGESFAVIVKYINAQGAEYAVECNYNSSGLSETENYFSTATANVGESYISNDGNTWSDINGYEVPGQGITYRDTNACIKAFTITTDAPITVPVTGVEITEKNVTLDKGNTASIVATVKPENATNKNVTWSSSDENVAKVVNGVVTGIGEGTATITVTTDDGGKTDTCTVTVNDNKQVEEIPVTGVKFDINLAEGVSLVVNKGTTYTVEATVLPENATNKNITWSSSDENIIKIANGVITAIEEGTATITVTTVDGNKTASITVKVVSNEVVPVESISLNKKTLEIEVGTETNLEVTFNPSDASNKNVRWTSSDEKVATISETGIIKALAEGKTTITVTSEDGNKTATCELTVVKKTNSDDDIYKSDGDSTTTNKKDTTTAKVELPNTGLRIMLIVLGTGIVLIGTVAFIKYRKYTDIK